MQTVQTSNVPAVAAIAALVITAGAALAQHDHSLIQAGRTDGNQLVMHTHAPMPFEVEPSIFPEFQGYATAEVAFESLMEDHPAIGVFLLDPRADIRAILVGADPDISVFDGLHQVAIGEQIVLGPPVFHYLPVYNINPGIPGQEYELRFQFHDASGIYSDSDVFGLRFTPVPAPAGAALFSLTALAAFRRRR
jgi:hypothetical protein